VVIAAIGNDKLWAQYCKILGARIWSSTRSSRPIACAADHRKPMVAILEKEMAKKTAAGVVRDL